MMCLLICRQYATRANEMGELLLDAVRHSPEARTWYSIYHRQNKLGYGEIAVSGDARGGAVIYRIDGNARLRIPGDVSALLQVSLRDPGGVEEFSLQVRGLGVSLACSGAVRGEECVVEYASGGSRGSLRLGLAGVTDAGITVHQYREEVIALKGVFIPARRYRIASPWGDANLWLGAGGSLLRAEFPGGLTIIQEPRSLAEKWTGGACSN